MKKLVLSLAAAALVAVGVVGAGLASTRAETYKLTAKLTAKQEVPKPTGAPAAATGKFTGTLVGRKLTWKLTFSHLSGPANGAHIHMGKPGKAGAVLVVLCPPNCKSGTHGVTTVKSDVKDAIEAGGTYVNVHTAKNPGGEIRGQVRSSEG